MSKASSRPARPLPGSQLTRRWREGFEPSVPRQRTLFETAPFELAIPTPREGPRLRISIPPRPSMAEGILRRPSSFTPISRPPICEWPEEPRLRRLSPGLLGGLDPVERVQQEHDPAARGSARQQVREAL